MWADSSVAAARLLLVATLLLLAAETTSAFAPAAGAAPAWSLHTAASGRSRRTNSSMSSSGCVGGCASNNELDMMDRIRRGLGPSRHESRQLVRGSHRHGPSSLAGERAGAAPTRAIARSGSPSRLCMSSDEHDDDSDDDNDARFPWSRSSHGKAFAAATCFRGGAASPASSSTSSGGGEDSGGIRPVIAAAVQSVDAGGTPRKNRLMIDYVEDALVTMWSHMVNVGVPVFHLGRFGFGLSLLFYGMAFRTFAFHVIVFRIAGMKQVQRAVRELVGNYASARRSIREAAKAAETVGERVVKGDDLQAARERMIEEKKRLLSDGFLSKRETIYFMKKYRAELLQIKEEQELFQSARSSVLSLRTRSPSLSCKQSSVDPRQARSSFNGVYNALIASFTASTIQTAGQFTLGLHIGNLLKTHVLDLFGPIIDPIGYRLDLSPYFDEEDIPYMGKANAMDGPRNMALNIFCYSVVFIVFQVHPSVALKLSMVYYGARVVTDYVVLVTEPARRKLGQMTIVHTPWSAVIHAGLTILGYCCHRNVLYTAEVPGLHPLAVGPGAVGLVEPVVRFAVKISEILSHIEFFKCKFVEDPVEMVKHMTGHRKVSVGPVEFLKKLVRRGE